MSTTVHKHQLAGCSPTPLAHYLKALGVLRILAEQVDSNVTGWWENDSFWIESALKREQITEFFLQRYSPTALITPWNGGSGFHPKDNQAAIETIAQSTSDRYALYRFVITQCKGILKSVTEHTTKEQLLQICRNQLPDQALDWLDAAYVLTSDGPKYPPLLGTGGNDGRLEFANNFMQHLLTLIGPDGIASADSEPRLQESLFRELSNCRHRGTVGQYDPGSLGGANNGTGFDGYSTANSWDYVLMLEGALLFAAASAKKLDSSDSGLLSYPFCVRPAGVGYGSAATTDEESSRAEMWLPLWGMPTNVRTLSQLLSEGRVETGKRKARNGVDFARAIVSLGIDRGIDDFQRFGFQQRNGLAYLAVPLGRFRVKANPGVEELLAPLDTWLDRFRRAATGKSAPARAGRALRRLESSILNLCQRGDATDVQATLIALGEAEASVAISKDLRNGSMGNGLSPVPLLSIDWLLKADDDSSEFRLASALASVTHSEVGPIRRHLEPIRLDPQNLRSKFPKWSDDATDPAIIWGSGSLVKNLCNVLLRRLVDAEIGNAEDKNRLAPLRGRLSASISDISAFIDGAVDEQKLESLFKALCLLDFPSNRNELASLAKAIREKVGPSKLCKFPHAGYSLLKLCFLPFPIRDKFIALDPRIARRAASGDGHEASRLAVRRLRADGFTPAIDLVPMTGAQSERIAAALMFPIGVYTANSLASLVLRDVTNSSRSADGDTDERFELLVTEEIET